MLPVQDNMITPLLDIISRVSAINNVGYAEPKQVYLLMRNYYPDTSDEDLDIKTKGSSEVIWKNSIRHAHRKAKAKGLCKSDKCRTDNRNKWRITEAGALHIVHNLKFWRPVYRRVED